MKAYVYELFTDKIRQYSEYLAPRNHGSVTKQRRGVLWSSLNPWILYGTVLLVFHLRFAVGLLKAF